MTKMIKKREWIGRKEKKICHDRIFWWFRMIKNLSLLYLMIDCCRCEGVSSVSDGHPPAHSGFPRDKHFDVIFICFSFIGELCVCIFFVIFHKRKISIIDWLLVLKAHIQFLFVMLICIDFFFHIHRYVWMNFSCLLKVIDLWESSRFEFDNRK